MEDGAVPRKLLPNPFSNAIGVDCGGTFTDSVFIGADGRCLVWKRSSTPLDPAASVLSGLVEARAEGVQTSECEVIHGTTIATNALLERRGAETGLITTLGFRDVLEIGRQSRDNLYSFRPSRTPPLLPPERRFEIRERLNWQGISIVMPDDADLDRLFDALKAERVTSIAVCLLFSYLNPSHEQVIGRAARSRGFDVSLSSEISPEPREFERSSTTVANAFVAPLMSNYLRRLDRETARFGVTKLRVMQSDGGALSAKEAAKVAVKTILSGPAGGIVAAKALSADMGRHRIITFDMGGTSTDVALILNGECDISSNGGVGGLPIRTPQFDIHTVGAGGGSLARMDAAGALRVGPQSAGAAPGPVAYGKGQDLTVTDANLFLGRLPADVRLGGRQLLDLGRVTERFGPFAKQLGCTFERAAIGIVAIADAAMVRALRHISVERGHDPGGFTLLSFGGAGGLHACALAEALGIESILIPRYPGAFSALGLALADVRREYVGALPGGSVWSEVTPDGPDLARALGASLLKAAVRGAATESLPADSVHYALSLDLRYVGQSFELRIPWSAGETSQILTAFHEAHRARYGHSDPNQPVEAVAVRLLMVGRAARPRLRFDVPAVAGDPSGTTRLHTGLDWELAPVFSREQLAAGQVIHGPAIIVQSDATTYVAPTWKSQTDRAGALLLTSAGAQTNRSKD